MIATSVVSFGKMIYITIEDGKSGKCAHAEMSIEQATTFRNYITEVLCKARRQMKEG